MTDEPPSADPYDGPGCGLAMYATVLLLLCIVGVIGIVAGTISMLMATPATLSPLVHGSQVAVWRVQPMRDAGLVALTEVPAAFHDESLLRDGTRVCALTNASVASLADGVGRRIPFSAVRDVSQSSSDEDTSVTITGQQTTIICQFAPGEGSDRFVRQIETEARRAAQSDSGAP